MRLLYAFACAGLVVLGSLACSSSGGPSPGSVADASSSDGGATDASSRDAASSPPDAGSDGDAGAPADAGSPPPLSDGGLPDAYGPVAEGGVFVQFITTDQTTYFDPAQQEMSTGTITFGVDNAAASDGKVATLTRTGGEASLGTGGAEEIVSNRTFSFGTFRYRLNLASCASTEEVVNGPFTYFNDGTKAADGLTINREVDIEILCGEPWLINLTIWTEYDDDTQCKNQSRVIDTQAGKIYVYADDQSNGDQTGTLDAPQLTLPGWPASGAFYELGFTWAPDHLAYFMNIGGSYVTLWDATDATRIPQAPMEQHFNIWAPGMSWSTGMTAPPPANDATLTLDWFRYDPQ